MANNEEIKALQNEIASKCEQLYNMTKDEYCLEGFMYSENGITGQLIVYSDNKYSSKIVSFLDELAFKKDK